MLRSRASSAANAELPAPSGLTRRREKGNRFIAGTAVSAWKAVTPVHCASAGIKNNKRWQKVEKEDYRGDC